MTARWRSIFALLRLALLAIAGWWIGAHLQLTGGLRKFMPARDTSWRAASPEAARAADIRQAPMAWRGQALWTSQ